ncbi:MAG: HK97-gp10 family putative phage morphogenesis protein [Oscillospiraceae bacterium]|nr:HK97-gp10 family putative phage morphogenesis protein [Oscillospiraceae bacterium]
MSSEVIKNLEQAIEKEIPEALYNALVKAAIIVSNDAKVDCPVDDGMLRQSIEYQVELNNGEAIGYVGTNVEYAPYVEKGTGIYNAEGRQTPWKYQDAKGNWHTTSGMKAQPFLQPALDNNQDKVQECFKDII